MIPGEGYARAFFPPQSSLRPATECSRGLRDSLPFLVLYEFHLAQEQEKESNRSPAAHVGKEGGAQVEGEEIRREKEENVEEEEKELAEKMERREEEMKKEEEEMKRREEEMKKEEEEMKRREEEEMKRRREEEMKRREDDMKRRREEERKKREDERKEEEEEKIKKKEEEEKKVAEEMTNKEEEEEEEKMRREEERKKREDERKEEEEEEKIKRKEEEEKKVAEEMTNKEEEEEKIKRKEEEDQKKVAEEMTNKEEEEEKIKRKEEEEKKVAEEMKNKEEEEIKRKEEEEEEEMKRKEEEKKKVEEEMKRKEEEMIKRKEEIKEGKKKVEEMEQKEELNKETMEEEDGVDDEEKKKKVEEEMKRKEEEKIKRRTEIKEGKKKVEEIEEKEEMKNEKIEEEDDVDDDDDGKVIIKKQETKKKVKSKSCCWRLVFQKEKKEVEGLEEQLRKAELRRELRWLANQILGDDGSCQLNVFEQAFKALAALKSLNFINSSERLKAAEQQYQRDMADFPEFFLCPISHSPMIDPVVTASGQTFDRMYIERWLRKDRPRCPVSAEPLTDTTLIPNTIIHNMISDWQASQNIYRLDKPRTIEDGILITQEDLDRLDAIIENISSLGITEKNNIKHLRRLAKLKPAFKAPKVIAQLLRILSKTQPTLNPELEEDIVTILLNASTSEHNKKIIGEDPLAIPYLVVMLNSGAAIETKTKCADALLHLSELYSNKIKIGELGAMGGLVELLEKGDLVGKKAVTWAIVGLCMAPENQGKAAAAKVVDVVVDLVVELSMVEEVANILWLLRYCQPAMAAIAKHRMISWFVHRVEEIPTKETREMLVIVLCHVFGENYPKLKEVLGEDYYEYWKNLIENAKKSIPSTSSEKEESLVVQWLKQRGNSSG